MYWSRPTVASGMRIAAAPNSISGTAVTTPAPARSAMCPAPSVVKVPSPLLPRYSR